MDNWQRINSAIGRLPPLFALSNYPGELFRISSQSSYVNDDNQVMLYLQRLVKDTWLDFAKATEEDIKALLVNI